MYCFKCGYEIRYDNETHTCPWCGEHIYGTPDANNGTELVSNWLQYGVIGSGILASHRRNLLSNREIENLYYSSVYYRQNGYDIWDVFNNKGKTGEYSLEHWIKGTYSNVRFTEPWSLFYNVVIPEPNGSFQEIDAILIILQM